MPHPLCMTGCHQRLRPRPITLTLNDFPVSIICTEADSPSEKPSPAMPATTLTAGAERPGSPLSSFLRSISITEALHPSLPRSLSDTTG